MKVPRHLLLELQQKNARRASARCAGFRRVIPRWMTLALKMPRCIMAKGITAGTASVFDALIGGYSKMTL